MGPDLIGIAGATAFLLAVVSVFALIDRLLCGAWEALNGSPACGLVTGIAAWADGHEPERTASSPGGPAAEPPTAPDPVATERVRPRVRGALFATARGLATA